MLTINEPFNNAVYQRDNQNRATIPLRGQARPNQPVTVTLSPTLFGETTSITLQSDSDGQYSGGISAVGGMYDVSVSDGVETATVRAGAGEVFVLFGHSFMQWPLGSAAQNPNVFTLADTLDQTAYQFERLTNRVGPFLSDGPGFAGMLGDKLVMRLNVPVLFYNTAFGGSNIDQNYKVIQGIPFEHSFIKYADRMPYRPLEKVLTDYVPKTGCRAVLFEHGYNDVSLTAAEFLDKLTFVTDYTRNHFGYPDLAFVMVQEETTGQADRLGSAAIGNALKSFIGSKSATWKGPDFNAGYWGTPGFHDAHAHLTVAGQAQFASDWDASLTAAFFSASNPVLADVPLTATTTQEGDYVVQASPSLQGENVNYILYGLAALFVMGLFNTRFRAKSLLVLLLLAVVFVYRQRQGAPTQVQVG